MNRAQREGDNMIGILIAALLIQGPRNLQVSEDAQLKPPLIVPAGTNIPIALTTRISTKTAKDGDGVYAKTVFPITIDNQIAIPEGSHLRGRIVEVKRPGRIKGKAELTVSFQTLVLPNGFTHPIFTSLGGVPGVTRTGEAGVEGEGTKGKDAGTIGTTAAQGAIIGAVGGRGKGAAIGGAGGAAVGAATVLLTRGQDLVLEPGTTLEIVLDRPLEP
jgi:type IV secretion system protein VirB10